MNTAFWIVGFISGIVFIILIALKKMLDVTDEYYKKHDL